jgi:hypothetical protein
VNGRPAELPRGDRGLAIKNNTLTLPGVAAMHGTIRLDLGPKGMLRAMPAAAGTGNRRDSTAGATTGLVGSAAGVYVRTADYLVMTIGDPSTATGTGTGAGAAPDPRQTAGQGAATPPQPGSVADTATVTTVGQPPVSLVLRRSTSADAPPSTAVAPPPGPSTGDATMQAAQNLRRISTTIGSEITLSDGSTAGRVEDLVMDSNGALDYAVLSNNGTMAAVPWGAMSWNAATGLGTLPLTRAQFATLPTFATTDWSNMLTNPAFTQRVNNTFINFRDVNGNAVFNNAMVNGVNRVGMRTNNSTQNVTNQGRVGSQSNTQPNQTNNQTNNQTQPNQTNNQTNPSGGRPGTPNPGGTPKTPPAQPKGPGGASPKIPPKE